METIDNTGAQIQKIEDLVGVTATGQATSANSIPIVIASDQSAVPISGTVTVIPSGTQDTNITEVSGAPISLANPAPVELSDGTNLIGTSTHPIRVDPTGTTPQPICFNTPTTDPLTEAAISFASSGDNIVVSAVSSQTTRVFRMYFTVAGATNITIKDGSTALTGAMTFTTGGSFILDFSSAPWYVTSTNSAFVINSSNAVQISGRVSYKQS